MREDRDITAHDLRAALDRAVPPVVIDVRSRREYDAGHVPGAIHVPFWAMPWRARRLALPRDRPLVVYCGHGPRARFAASLLRWAGYTPTACLAGHMAGWRSRGFPEAR